MVQVLVWSCVMVLVLLVFNVLVNYLCGLDSGGEFGKVAEGIMAIVILYMLVVGLFGGGLELAGIPFVDKLDQYGSLSAMFRSDKSVFLLESAKLISLTFLISMISNILPGGFGGSGYNAKIIKSIAVALAGIGVNHYFFAFAEQTQVFSWALDALSCFISGASLVLTPAMLLGRLLNLDSEHAMVSLLVKKLPQTKVGRALSAAATNSLVLIFSLMLLESQCGSLTELFRQIPLLIASLVAPVAVTIIGLRLMIKSITR